MRPNLGKNCFLTISLIAIASLAGVLTACSSSQTDNSAAVNQTKSANTPTTTNVGNMQHTGHGSMNHSMSMDLGPADANYDLRFIDAMIPHHQGAVTMAQQALSKSKRSEIKKLAQDLITGQKQEISQLQQWRQAWYPQASTTPMAYDSSKKQMMPMSQAQMQGMMMQENLGNADANFDLRFINAMIPHHEGAISMAQDALAKSKRPEIKQLAQAIVKTQKVEINQMKQWRQAWYKQ